MPSQGQTGGGWLLSQTSLFENLKITDKSGGSGIYKPIVAIYGEKCYAWSKPKHSLFVINTGELYKTGSDSIDASDVQEWQLSQRLGFDVINIVPYSTMGAFGGATSVLLWGKNGLAVVTNQNVNRLDEPSSFPGGSSSSNGILRLVKKTILLGEKTYIDHPRLEVIQAKWLPSTFATHPKTVAVLNSDNYFRFYRVDNTKEKEVISCGSVSVEPNSAAAIPFVNRSGRFAADVEEESVADFDIGPCLPKSKFYPLFVLREAGCVSYVLVRFVGKNTTFFSEAHKIMPTVGLDMEERTATSIIVSKTYPIFAAIGFTGGAIMHCLVMPDFDEQGNANERMDESQNVEEKFIYDGFNLEIKERLDLDFLSNSSSNYLKLVADPLHSHRYACIHDIGLHIISAHFYPEIVKFFQSEEEEDLPEVTKSTYQLLLRWRLGEAEKPQRDLMSLSFSQRKPQRVLCILQDLRALLFELPDPSFETSLKSSSRTNSIEPTASSNITAGPSGSQEQRENIFSSSTDVQEVCKDLLKRSSVEPYLCSKEEIPLRELENYVIQTIQLKSERLGGVEDGMQYLAKIVSTMQDKLKKMEEMVNTMSNIRGELQGNAESMAERYEECVEQDELHAKRLEAILSRYHHATPVVTDKEKEWGKTLEAIQEDIPDLQSAVRILRERMEEKKNADISDFHNNLTDTQLGQIKEELRNQTESLNALSYSLKQISEHMYYPALMSVRPKPRD